MVGYWQFKSQDEDVYSDVHEYDNSKIEREHIFGQRKWGVHQR